MNETPALAARSSRPRLLIRPDILGGQTRIPRFRSAGLPRHERRSHLAARSAYARDKRRIHSRTKAVVNKHYRLRREYGPSIARGRRHQWSRSVSGESLSVTGSPHRVRAGELRAIQLRLSPSARTLSSTPADHRASHLRRSGISSTTGMRRVELRWYSSN